MQPCYPPPLSHHHCPYLSGLNTEPSAAPARPLQPGPIFISPLVKSGTNMGSYREGRGHVSPTHVFLGVGGEWGARLSEKGPLHRDDCVCTLTSTALCCMPNDDPPSLLVPTSVCLWEEESIPLHVCTVKCQPGQNSCVSPQTRPQCPLLLTCCP